MTSRTRSLSAWYTEEVARQTDDVASDRLPFGQAAIVILVLSLVAWGLILAPFLLL